MLDLTKKYMLGDGRVVSSLKYIPFTPDGKRVSHPIRGLVDTTKLLGKKKRKQYMVWTSKGTYYTNQPSNFDLLEVK